MLYIFFLSIAFGADPVLTGSWKGHWNSDVNGHNGPIKANFKEKEGVLYVRLRGRYAKVLPFFYRIKLIPSEQEDGIHYTVEKSLGKKWGTFTLDATVTNDSFVALYRSQNDHGRFVLEPQRK
jgi:hypothetical protein